MITLLRTGLAVVRIIQVALILIVAWPVGAAYLSDDITWDQAVDSIFTDRTIGLILGVLVVSLALSLLRNPAVRLVVLAATVAVVFMLATGRLSVGEIRDSVASFDLTNRVDTVVDGCGWDVSTETVGGTVRAVLKDPSSAGAVVGYIVDQAGRLVQLDPNTGEPTEVGCE